MAPQGRLAGGSRGDDPIVPGPGDGIVRSKVGRPDSRSNPGWLPMPRRLALWPLVLLAALLLPEPASAQDPPFDLVIRNGRIVDGTGNPWSRGDLAIRGDRIAAVGRIPADAPARRTIDASGLVVAPGFIDAHSHSDWVLFEDGNAPSKVRQGVTTDVLGEDRSGGPHRGKLAPRPVAIRGETARLDHARRILRRPRSGRASRSTSRATSAWGTSGAASWATRSTGPRPAQLEEMEAILDEAMRDGALGLSTMLAAPQEMVATTDDLVALCRVVRRHGGIYASHMRSEGTDVLQAVREAIADRRAVRRARRDHPPEDRRPGPLGPDGRDRRADRGRPGPRA